MEEQIIQIPDTLEIKEIKDGKIILVEKEKKLTYKDIADKIFPIGGHHFYINNGACIERASTFDKNYKLENNTISEKQADKLLAINKLMNVAKYLNDGWQPDWNNTKENKYYIIISEYGNQIHCNAMCNNSIVYFKSKEFAKQAIEILGEETIRLALCTDY